MPIKIKFVELINRSILNNPTDVLIAALARRENSINGECNEQGVKESQSGI